MPRRGWASPLRYRAVIVAVATMRVMQVSPDEIIRVVTVRHRLVSASFAMLVVCLVAFAAVARRTCIGIGVRHRQGVLIVVTCMLMVQVPVVQVVGMVAVLDCGVTAVRSMRVIVISVRVVVGHVETILVGRSKGGCTSEALALFSFQVSV